MSKIYTIVDIHTNYIQIRIVAECPSKKLFLISPSKLQYKLCKQQFCCACLASHLHEITTI